MPEIVAQLRESTGLSLGEAAVMAMLGQTVGADEVLSTDNVKDLELKLKLDAIGGATAVENLAFLLPASTTVTFRTVEAIAGATLAGTSVQAAATKLEGLILGLDATAASELAMDADTNGNQVVCLRAR